MEKLRLYLNSLTPDQQVAYATSCGTTVNYLRKAISKGQEFKAALCINLVRESHGALMHEDIIPGADWQSVRQQNKKQKRVASCAA